MFFIYLHNNIDDVSWEYVNQFEINLIKKRLKLVVTSAFAI